MTDPTEKLANAKEVNSFITLRKILLELDDITITELDEAIEEHGIYTKGRNGRYIKHSYHSDHGERALNLLSYFKDYELKNQRSWCIFTEVYKSPLENFIGKSKPADYDLYGWLEDKLPDFHAKDSKLFEEKPLSEKERKGYIRTISVLLKFIKGEMKGVKKHLNYESDSILIRDIEAEYHKNNNGLSVRSLEKKFSDANKDNLFK